VSKKGKRNYKGLFNRLVKSLEKEGTKVVLVSDRFLGDYAGMNPEAAKAMGFRMPKDTIYITESSPYEERYKNLMHEIGEEEKMEDGQSYWKAHRQELREERQL
jgi:hypothetical protein